jgi:hypothetical protein
LERRTSETHAARLVLTDDPTWAGELPFDEVGIDRGTLLRRAYGIRGTPAALTVDAHGRVASRVAYGVDEVLTLAGVDPHAAVKK